MMVRAMEIIMVQSGSDVISHNVSSCIVSQLQACMLQADRISGVCLWVVGSDFPQATISSGGFTKDFLSIRALVQTIQQPVLGVVLGFVDPLATKFLEACDYVIADSSTVFSTDEHGGQMLADEALRTGLVQTIVQKRDLVARCDIMTRMFEIHSHEELARLKAKFRSGKPKPAPGQDGATFVQQLPHVQGVQSAQPAMPKVGAAEVPPSFVAGSMTCIRPPPGLDPPMPGPALGFGSLPLPPGTCIAAAPAVAGLQNNAATSLSTGTLPAASEKEGEVKAKYHGHRTVSTLFSSSMLPEIEEEDCEEESDLEEDEE